MYKNEKKKKLFWIRRVSYWLMHRKSRRYSPDYNGLLWENVRKRRRVWIKCTVLQPSTNPESKLFQQKKDTQAVDLLSSQTTLMLRNTSFYWTTSFTDASCSTWVRNFMINHWRKGVSLEEGYICNNLDEVFRIPDLKLCKPK